MQRLLLALALLAPSAHAFAAHGGGGQLQECLDGAMVPVGITPIIEATNGLKVNCFGEEEKSPCQDGEDGSMRKALTIECPLTLDCGVDQGCRGLDVKAEGSITADCTGQQAVCKFATFSAPTVTIDCTGNRSCEGISFDKDVVEKIELTCGPNVMDNKVDENFVCTDIEIPEEAMCTCISTEVIEDGNRKVDTSCPKDCTEP